MPQISSTGVLANISVETMSNIRMTAEHNSPMKALVENFTLPKGSDTEIFPKAGQVNVRALNEGEEMTNEQDIGLSTISVQTNEVGGYIVLSSRLLRRTASSAGNLARIVGKQFGVAQGRLMNTDLLALLSGLNGGTDLGAAGRFLTAANATNVISHAQSEKFGSDLRFVHHPNAIMKLATELSTVGSGTIRPIPEGFSKEILSKVWKGMQIWDVPFFETGDISRDGSDDAIGGIFDKGAMGVLSEAAPRSDKNYLPRRRAWELVFVQEYIAFELDDSMGAPVTMDAANPATT